MPTALTLDESIRALVAAGIDPDPMAWDAALAEQAAEVLDDARAAKAARPQAQE